MLTGESQRDYHARKCREWRIAHQDKAREYNREWQRDHKDLKKEYAAKSYKRCKQHINAKNKQYYEDHKMEVADQHKKYVTEHREQYRAYTRKHYRKYRAQILQKQKESNIKNPDRIRTVHYKHAYGISGDQFDIMNTQQNGLCAICHNRDPFRKYLSVDHIRGTKTVRGLLCHRCNVAIGLFLENTDRLKSAIEYLERSKVC